MATSNTTIVGLASLFVHPIGPGKFPRRTVWAGSLLPPALAILGLIKVGQNAGEAA